jgi:adenylate cyclase
MCAKALAAAHDIQRRCSVRKATLVAEGFDPTALGLGIGVHTGVASFGEFGKVHKDFTAIGETVNLAARLQAAARPGEVLVSGAVLEKLEGEETAGARACSLKGYAESVTAYLM